MQGKESIIVIQCELKILSPGPLKILIVVYACKNVHVLSGPVNNAKTE